MQVYKRYITEDTTFSFEGEVILTGVDGVKSRLIDTGFEQNVCKNHFISWGTVKTTVLEPGKSFKCEGNEIVIPNLVLPRNLPYGREVCFHA